MQQLGAAVMQQLGAVGMRLLGAGLLIMAMGLLGFAAGLWYSQRAAQLRSFALALQVLETEIGFGVLPLAAALQRAGSVVEPPVRDVFYHAARHLTERPGCPGSDAWAEALARHGGKLALRGDERAVLRAVGVRLGASHGDDQIRYLESARHTLRAKAEEAEAQRDTGVRLWRYLGLSAGVATVLLLY